MPSNDDWKIRQARLADLKKIARMESAIWKEMAADEATLARRFRCFPAGFLVAEDRHSLGGFCMALRVNREALTPDHIGAVSLESHQPSGRILFLLGLTVDPLFRRRGIGTALVRGELELASAASAASVQLVANAHSVSLFSRLGFSVVRLLDGPEFRKLAHLMPSPTHMRLGLR